MINIKYQKCDNVISINIKKSIICFSCGNKINKRGRYIDLLKKKIDLEKTAKHYGTQWSDKLGFHKFVKENKKVRQVMPMSRLGWTNLIEEIRGKSLTESISVYDAACGYGDIAEQLTMNPCPNNLLYIGADIQNSLEELLERVPIIKNIGWLLRWDISNPLPVLKKFDYVLCRAAIHHTPDPEKTFNSLCMALKKRGKIAISAYRRKSILRESSDNTLRNIIGKMSDKQAFESSKQFSFLGKQLQKLREKIEITKDLPLLGVKKGSYEIQEFIYNYFLKCFYNKSFGEKYSTLVNYDWYHPEFAFRYDINELRLMFNNNRITITNEITIEAQHYLEGIKE